MTGEIDYRTHPIESILFIDIETVRKVKELEEGTPLYDSFVYKMRYTEEAQRKDFNSYNVKALFAEKAALYPEFGKVACITVGRVVEGKLVIYTFKDDEESTQLQKFNSALERWALEDSNLALCGVNLKFFDLRFIFIRSVVHQIRPVKGHIDLSNLKPWLVKTIDITDAWKQTSPYNAPLVCMAESLGLPSPKSDIDGSQVSDVYWNEGKEGMKRIVKYCERDVFTTANILRKLRFEPIFELDEKPAQTGKTKPAKAKTKKEEQKPDVSQEMPLDLSMEEDNSLVLKRIYTNNEITKQDKKELLELIGKKRMYKKDKPILIDMIHRLSINSDMFSKDKPEVIAEKLKTVEELINNL